MVICMPTKYCNVISQIYKAVWYISSKRDWFIPPPPQGTPSIIMLVSSIFPFRPPANCRPFLSLTDKMAQCRKIKYLRRDAWRDRHKVHIKWAGPSDVLLLPSIPFILFLYQSVSTQQSREPIVGSSLNSPSCVFRVQNWYTNKTCIGCSQRQQSAKHMNGIYVGPLPPSTHVTLKNGGAEDFPSVAAHINPYDSVSELVFSDYWSSG